MLSSSFVEEIKETQQWQVLFNIYITERTTANECDWL